MHSNKILQSVFLALTMTLAVGASAADKAAKADAPKTVSQGKIAVIDLQRAIMMTSVAREQIKALESQKDYAEDQKKAEALRQDIIKKQQDMEKERPTWTAEQQADREKELDFAKQNFQLLAQKLQGENQELFRKVQHQLDSKINDAIKSVVQEENISMLLRVEAALWAAPDMDITDRVTQKLDQAK